MPQDSLQQPVWLADGAVYTAYMTQSEQQGLVPSATLASVRGAIKHAIMKVDIRVVPGRFWAEAKVAIRRSPGASLQPSRFSNEDTAHTAL